MLHEAVGWDDAICDQLAAAGNCGASGKIGDQSDRGDCAEMVVVSVVVPYLNQERYLAEAIQSVQAQSFTDWELLLVDDGSTDLGPEIAARYAETDRRIRLLKHAEMCNRGVSA